ncbi:hypothetical protein AB833_25950 [Chromatiales bacterium (ex Bugula neritina AB1)]|nr:hypothetical protein AB833_25950 [Chromatiales bacterium (ex Bugula neritina AB1)]
MKLSSSMMGKLRCPSALDSLALSDAGVLVTESGQSYPVVRGCPVLINEPNSLFKIDDFKNNVDTTFDLTPGILKRIFIRFFPKLGVNIKSEKNYNRLIDSLPAGASILVVGGSIEGQGAEKLYESNSYDVVSSDVSFGPKTTLICDAHDIPFEDKVFDCVIIQAVLEHVLDPVRCVAEIHRVLADNGVVYAETPFMQQVHAKQYDFTRFTHLGHRRLFRHFSEVESGPVCGPGMALAWSYSYFLRSMSSTRWLNRMLTVFAHCTGFFLKYFDYWLINKPGSYDAASAFYFWGRKSDQVLSDHDLIAGYKGVK